MINPFFKNTGPYEINDLLKLISIKDQSFSDEKINDIKDLSSSKKGDMTFLHSKKYGELAKSTNASFCVTSENLKSLLPANCKTIISDKILLDVAKITKKFYPNSVTDDFDVNVEKIENIQFKNKVKFGRNVLICLLYTSPSPRDDGVSRMPSSA